MLKLQKMDNELVTIGRLARMLKIDIRWLRKETNAGRIPHLSAGNNTLFNPATVREVLAEQARAKGEQQHIEKGVAK